LLTTTISPPPPGSDRLPRVRSSHIEGGVEYGTCFQALMEKRNP
jgi:hypothetical protein